MFSEEIQHRIAWIRLLACILPAFLLILAAGICDGTPEVSQMPLGAGGMGAVQTVLLMMRIAVLGTRPLIKMSFEVRLALCAGSAALLVLDGCCFTLIGQDAAGFVVVGAGLGDAVLIAYLLAIGGFGDHEIYDDRPAYPDRRWPPPPSRER